MTTPSTPSPETPELPPRSDAGGHDEHPGDANAPEGGGGPTFPVPKIFPVRKAVAAWLGLLSLSAAMMLVFRWWTPVQKPDLTALIDTPTDSAGTDVEQAEFLNRALESVDGPRTLTDRQWVSRLAGAWWIDLGQGPTVVVFDGDVVTRTEIDGGIVELRSARGRGVPPYFAVLGGSEGSPEHRFLAFQNEAGAYVLLLDDLASHGDDRFSFRLGGTRTRRDGRRLQVPLDELVPGSIGRTADREVTTPSRRRPLFRLEPSERDAPRARRTVDDMWRQAEDLRQQGRFQTLERLLVRIVLADPTHREARRWQRQLPGWQRRQLKQSLGRLEDRLRHLAGYMRSGDLDGALGLFAPGAQAQTRPLLVEYFRSPRRRAGIQLSAYESVDGMLIFDATCTLESGRPRGRSIETVRWKSRLVDGRFLDPLER